MDIINDLPGEILILIFSFYIQSQGYQRFIKNIPLVCKKWYDLHSDPVLWRDVNSGDQCFTYRQLENLGERGFLKHARYLKLEDYIFHESPIIKLIRYYRNLTEVNISYCFLSKVALEILAEKCPNIKSLDLHVSNDPMILEDKTLNFLLSRGNNLKRLRLTFEFGLKYEDLVSAIAINCHSLEELKLVGYRNILHVDELVVGCPNLRILDVLGHTVVSSGSRVPNGFENMISFHASMVDFGGIDLYSILRSSKKLEVLDISNCTNVMLRNISRIPSDKVKCFHISHMSSYGRSKFVEEAVGKWKRSLTSLRLVGMRRFFTKVLKIYLNENPNPKLEILDFKASNYVEEDVLVEVIKAAKNLQFVRVTTPKRHVFLDGRDSVKRNLREPSDSP